MRTTKYLGLLIAAVAVLIVFRMLPESLIGPFVLNHRLETGFLLFTVAVVVSTPLTTTKKKLGAFLFLLGGMMFALAGVSGYLPAFGKIAYFLIFGFIGIPAFLLLYSKDDFSVEENSM